jgi:hypothetical protein
MLDSICMPLDTVPEGHHHAVQFYGDDAELMKTAGAFLAEGVAAGEAIMVIATPAHRTMIEAALRGHIDVDSARRLGDLVLLDAEETLATFMVHGMPSAALFRRVITDVIDQALRGRERTPIRAYGEMVDVLWKQGKTEAAIRLEVLWNDLATSRRFSLLCGYAIGNFFKQAHIDSICEHHTHVHPHGQTVLQFPTNRSAKGASPELSEAAVTTPATETATGT